MSKLNINIKAAKKNYIKYGEHQLKVAAGRGIPVTESITLKIPHGISMSDTVGDITQNTGLFNESYDSSSRLDGLEHDVGRFAHFLITGNLIDYNLEQKTGIIDHGLLGRKVLLEKDVDGKRLIEKLIEDERRYDYVLSEMVGNHTSTHDKRYDYTLSDVGKQFKDYGIEEILASNNEELINLLIGAKVRIVREADSLELFLNLLSGAWKPMIGIEQKELAREEVFALLYNNEGIEMNDLKPRGLWSLNSGAILRIGLLARKANMLSSFIVADRENWIDKIYQLAINSAPGQLDDSIMQDAYSFTEAFVKNIIRVASGNILVTEQEKAKALELTQKDWQR